MSVHPGKVYIYSGPSDHIGPGCMGGTALARLELQRAVVLQASVLQDPMGSWPRNSVVSDLE